MVSSSDDDIVNDESSPSLADSSTSSTASMILTTTVNKNQKEEEVLSPYHELFLQPNPWEFDFPIRFEDGMGYDECENYYSTINPRNSRNRQNFTTTGRLVSSSSSGNRIKPLRIPSCKDELIKQVGCSSSLRSCLLKTKEHTSTGGSSSKNKFSRSLKTNYKTSKTQYPHTNGLYDIGDAKNGTSKLHDSLQRFNESWSHMNRTSCDNEFDNNFDINISNFDDNNDEETSWCTNATRNMTLQLHQSLHDINDYLGKNGKLKPHVTFAKSITVTTVYPFYEYPDDVWFAIWTPSDIFQKQLKQSIKEQKKERRAALRDKQAAKEKLTSRLQAQKQQQKHQSSSSSCYSSSSCDDNASLLSNNSSNGSNNTSSLSIEEELFGLPIAGR